MSSVNKNTTALIMAGGTGGHIFPGIAVANALFEKGWDICWLGSSGGMEEQLVAKHNIKIRLISIKGLRGKGVLGWLKAPFSLSKAVYEAIKVIRLEKPDVVIGFGGFASGPGGVAAFMAGIPLIVHEQNAIAGLTNRILAKLSKKVFQAFPGAFVQSNKVETVGNPIRAEIKKLNMSGLKIINHEVINILVIGGSRGALALNRHLPKAFKQLVTNGEIKIKHQVGQGRLEETKKFYQQTGIIENEYCQLFEFIDDMAEAFNWADLVICRAGASTVSEIAAVGVGAIFVPYPYAVDDHQTANANWLVQQNAALCVVEKDVCNESFSALLTQLVKVPEKLNEMAANAREVAYLNAAETVADFCDVLKVKAA
ncbi:undecaprenyldiphospho-muramoylpentapeptide beta-N-acetylglucosaminyltransferase [Aliikangiella sp. IMCC44359]|uniref:undecaprenyldiphospho-muramoylpentapeptide beta-N-acetylglucosaminyltransferase n=1 Tax=Aliikangiella sp. IMCC44359 TaxID=3459125 RepID=UPI00403AEF6B